MAKMKSFADVKIGDIGEDYNGLTGEVIKKGPAGSLLRYDYTGAMKDAISEGYADEDEDAVAVRDEDGDTVVFVYGGDGFCVDEEIDVPEVDESVLDYSDVLDYDQPSDILFESKKSSKKLDESKKKLNESLWTDMSGFVADVMEDVDYAYSGIYTSEDDSIIVKLDEIVPAFKDVEVSISKVEDGYFISVNEHDGDHDSMVGDIFDEVTAEAINEEIEEFLDNNAERMQD